MTSVAESPVFPQHIAWESAGTSRIPFMSYTSEELHRRELERFFYKRSASDR